jgi:glycerophosphoryl diester phosphodiesterase
MTTISRAPSFVRSTLPRPRVAIDDVPPPREPQLDVDTFESPAPVREVRGVERLTDPNDRHIPSIDEAFEVASRFPGKVVQLDTKLPEGKPEVARRMARQYMEALRKYPQLKDQVFIACNDEKMLKVMKDEFKASKDFSTFNRFSLDKEQLNAFFIGNSPDAADPLKGSGTNAFVSIGDPRAPLSTGNFDDLLRLTKQTLSKTRDPKSPHFGKQLVVWTINDEDKMRKLAKLKPDFIVTDNPALLNKVLDEVCGKNDPLRPKVQCHRGGPDGSGAPENTLPMLERGFREGDSIEFDVCSAVDGAVLYHDENPNAVVSLVRNLGLGGEGEFRPTYPGLGSPLRKSLHELTTEQIRQGYGYEYTGHRADR